MRFLWLCAILLAAWPRVGSARGVFGDENQTIPLNNPPYGELRGYYVRMSPLNLLHAGFGMGMPLNPRPAVPDPTLETFGRAYYMIDMRTCSRKTSAILRISVGGCFCRGASQTTYRRAPTSSSGHTVGPQGSSKGLAAWAR